MLVLVAMFVPCGMLYTILEEEVNYKMAVYVEASAAELSYRFELDLCPTNNLN